MAGSEKLRCPKCGAPILETDTECMNCGAELSHGRLVEDVAAQPAAPGLHVDHGVAEVEAGNVEYRTLPTAVSLDWGALAGGGFFAALSRSWRFFTACLEMLADYPLMIVPALLSVLVSLAIVAAGAGVLYLLGVWDQWTSGNDESVPWQVYVVMVPTLLVAYAAMLSFMGMIAHMVDAYLRGRRATLGQALADVLQNFPALFYLAVVNTVLSLLLSAVRRRSRSWAGRALTDTADRARMVANNLVVPVIMIEDKPFTEALRRAYDLFKGSVLDVVVAELGLLVFNRVLSFVFALIAVGAFVASAAVAPALVPVAIAGLVGLLLLTVAVTSFIRTAYYTCLYLWAAAMETLGTEQVPAPAPIAKALAAA